MLTEDIFDEATTFYGDALNVDVRDIFLVDFSCFSFTEYNVM